MQNETLSSAPALFRNFGSGAFCLIFAATCWLLADEKSEVVLRQMFTVEIGTSVLLSSLVVIGCYYIGAICGTVGSVVTWLLPSRYTEKEIELQAEVVLLGISEMHSYSERWRISLENYWTLTGVGIVLSSFQLSLGFSIGFHAISFAGVVFYFFAAALGVAQGYLANQRFRALVYLVSKKQKEKK